MYLKTKLIVLAEELDIYCLRGKEKPKMTVIYLAHTTWVDEARDQVCWFSFGSVNLRCQLDFQVEMLSRQYNLQYIS